jgi:hypothetical protein
MWPVWYGAARFMIISVREGAQQVAGSDRLQPIQQSDEG